MGPNEWWAINARKSRSAKNKGAGGWNQKGASRSESDYRININLRVAVLVAETIL
jgi:hypothetical protein